MRKLLSLLVLLLYSLPHFGQNSPADPKLRSQTEARFVMSSDDMRSQNFRAAASSLNWIMRNTPKYFDGVYINAYKAYERMAELEKDRLQKQVFLDSMILTYKLKEELFDLTVRERNNLAYRYFKYFKNDKTKLKDALNAYRKVYTNPDQVINNNLVSYMYLAGKFYNYETMPIEEIISIRQDVLDVISIKRAKGEDPNKLNRYEEIIDRIFFETTSKDLSCNQLIQNFAPKLKEHRSLDLAKKMFTLILDKGCTDQIEFITAAEIIQEMDPSKGIAEILAKHYVKSDNLVKALNTLLSAIELTGDDDKKASLYLQIARIYQKQNDKINARSSLIKAQALSNSNNEEAYLILGQLYMDSFEECKKLLSHTKDRAVFMLAFDMFEKANDKARMTAAQRQFPTKSQVHVETFEVGKPIVVGCWINENTLIRARSSN